MEFRVLGPLEVEQGGSLLAVREPRRRALLALLVVHANEVVSRERLIDALWGEEPPASAAQALQVYVHGLRRLLGKERIVTRAPGYLLVAAEGEVDLQRFLRLAAEGREALDAEEPGRARRRLARALELWRGDALGDVGDAPFVRDEAARLEELRLEAVEARIEADLALDRLDGLVAELETLVAVHPFRERLRELLMLVHYRAGRQADALAAYQAARRTLRDELGIEPGPRLQELERAVLAQDPTLAAQAEAKPVAATRASSLPSPPSALVGRRLELAAVTALLRRSDVRLLTLTGVGGTGKTRLALAAAAAVAGDYDDGVVFVDLSALSDPDLVVGTIAHAVGAESDAAAEVLAQQHLLLVLDNFEQLLAAAPALAELLAAAPRVDALVTSRAALRLSGEHEYQVPPLGVPDPGRPAALDELERVEAVALFTARARAARPDFELTERTAPAVAAICAQLEGLPLALELAAARVKVLGPDAIRARLDSRFELLTGGARDLPARQRTLRATLDWSFELLDPDEQRLVCALAVFAGGCELDSVEAVCAADLDALASLVDKSLLRRVDADDPRFAMLETVREYSLERAAPAELDAVRRRHATHFTDLAEEAFAAWGPDDVAWFERLDRDHDNLRAALAWAGEHDAELQLRLATALAYFWRIRGYFGEGREWLDRSLEARADADALRAKALAGNAALAMRMGDFEQARACCEQRLEIVRALGDEAEEGGTLAEMGAVALHEGDLERAEELLEHGVVVFRRLGNRTRLGIALANLGVVATERGDLDAAERLTQEALALHRELDDHQSAMVDSFNLGRVVAERGDPARAASLFAETLAAARAMGYREVIAYSLSGLGDVTAADDPERAAHLLGASEGQLEVLGVRPDSSERDLHERARERVRALLGDGFEEAVTVGRELTPDQAAELATAAAADALKTAAPRPTT
ncbi:MAG TPA: BTAD domain-containing putative transcriptional regulator [Gaiellaceae bacterium]